MWRIAVTWDNYLTCWNGFQARRCWCYPALIVYIHLCDPHIHTTVLDEAMQDKSRKCIWIWSSQRAPNIMDDLSDARGGGGGVGTPSLKVIRYAPGFCPKFSTSGRSFCSPKCDQICHFIQILLGPILNLERRTPTMCLPFPVYISI